MACACGKTTQVNVQFAYIHPTTKQTTTYKSEIEARAAQIRNGGGTYTPVPVR